MPGASLGARWATAVFRAVDERLGRSVALKVASPALAADQGFRDRFIRESRAAAAVDDPHIVPIDEAAEADDVLYIAMRYVLSGDVRTLMPEQAACRRRLQLRSAQGSGKVA
jgi:serine/threonine protein kinase